jgi:hypothetical protein
MNGLNGSFQRRETPHFLSFFPLLCFGCACAVCAVLVGEILRSTRAKFHRFTSVFMGHHSKIFDSEGIV